MADYKLSELNSIDTIRSDDLLHVRVKKRPEMLGDEDRRMTYQDFLASFKLERFVQIAGSTMTGDLGIVKLLYGGKAVFDPTGSSEINIGDVLKTFKINANGLKLTIADASRSATVYHTLNKPSPNELGMRTNEENDARYSRLAVKNTFSSTQAILSDNEALIVKNITQGMPLYVRGQDADGTNRWYFGNDVSGRDNLVIKNVKSGAYVAILDNLISVNKSIQIVGQVQPSNWANLDDRYFTQTVANQRFAQLAGNNTFSGSNTFTNFVVKKNANAITIQNVDTTTALYIQARKSDGANKWYIGNDGDENIVNIYNYLTKTQISLGNTITMSKTVQIGGQVQPSDWTNIDSRYIPAATLSTIAKTNATNTFSAQQIINSDGEALVLKAKTASSLFIRCKDADGANKWFVGNGDAGDALGLYNYRTGKGLTIDSVFRMNATLAITGQVQPSDWSNLDARFLKVSGSTATNLVITETGHGLSIGRDFTINTRDAFNRVCGWSAMTTVSNIPNYPLGPYAYMFVFGKRNTSAPGQVALHTNYNSSGLYLSRCLAQSDEVMFEKIYTDKTKPTPSELGAYTKAETDQKIATAISDSTDLNKIYPVGIVTWFNSNVNPNTALPGLTWTYLNNGVGRTIRIAAANGSDVATTGGSDSVTLAVGNLPSHTHSFSATTSSFDYGTKGTNTTGEHTHSGSGSTSTNGNHTHYIAAWNGTGAGGNKMSSYAVASRAGGSNTDAAGNHSHTFSFGTSGAGDHSHSVGIGAHSHTVSGNTGGTGSGSAFSVTNQFYKLMAWVRTA